MDRCAVFVDAGYLHESAKTLMLAGHPGATVRANAASLVREITTLAVAQTELPLLRIYWYAAAPNRNPLPDQRELASLGNIKLRLGNLRERAGGRMVQKGVDAELHADMTGLARNRGAVDFVLLSGDEDLLRAVDEVQSFGVRVHLWGVEAGPDGGNQSLELIAAADRRYVLEEAWIRGVFTIREGPKLDSPMARVPVSAPAEPARIPLSAPGVESTQGPPAGPLAPGPTTLPGQQVPAAAQPGSAAAAASGTPAPSTPAAASAMPAPAGRTPTPGSAATRPPTPAASGQPQPTGAAPSRPGPVPVPKPSDLPPRAVPGVAAAAHDTLLYSSSAAHSGYQVPDYEFHRLSDLTTQAEQFADSAEDAATVFDSLTVGRVYAQRWLSRATTEAAAMIALEYPTIPRGIDAELLRYAVSRGVDTWSSETDKFAVRQAFWSAVREATREPIRPANGRELGGDALRTR